MKLTPETFRSDGAQLEYLSCHQYSDFQSCSARAMAILKGTWSEEEDEDKKPAYGVGNFTELGLMDPAGFAKYKTEHVSEIFTEPTLAEIKEAHPGYIIKGAKKADIIAAHPELVPELGSHGADYVTAERMIKRVQKHGEALYLLAGPNSEQQVVITGEINGAKWKGLADVVIRKGKIVLDFKTAKDYEKVWKERANYDGQVRNIKVPFYSKWGYVFQIGIYRELCEQMFGGEWLPIIMAVSKQKPSDLLNWKFTNRDRLDQHVAIMLSDQAQILAIKRGDAEPAMCLKNKCPYCREHRPFTILEADLSD